MRVDYGSTVGAFDHVTPDIAIYQNEILGPVLVVRTNMYTEAINLVHQDPYGIGTAAFS